ncbi:MAG: hypothetical protein PQJ60_14895 [Spirochaetales bacterium]|nr:hypothetical protein [Spirochaetales bacterium]
MSHLKKVTLLLIFASLATALTAEETWVSFNGLMRSYSQNESYDSTIDRMTETDLGYGLQGMYLFDRGFGFYGSFSLLTPQEWDISYTDGSEDDNDLSTGMETASGYGYMLGVGGKFSPTEFLDFYLALGYAGTSITLEKDKDGDEYSYKVNLKGVGTDFGVKMNVQESIYLNVGTSLILQLSADEEYTSSGTTESSVTSLACLDVRPYFGLGIRF